MPSATEGKWPEYRVLVFGSVTAVCAAITAWAVARGKAPIRVLLLGSLTAYALGLTLTETYGVVPRFERLAAIPLGVIGAVAYALGAPTDLPILFVLLGVASLVDLVWDPTGTTDGNRSE